MERVMGVLGKKLRGLEGGLVAFMCPGCGELHQFRVEGEGRPKWGYNGNPDSPTFTPSVLVRGVRSTMTEADWAEYDKYDVKADREKILADHRFKSVCHSFVRDGQTQFLGDCTHELASQTVELPDVG